MVGTDHETELGYEVLRVGDASFYVPHRTRGFAVEHFRDPVTGGKLTFNSYAETSAFLRRQRGFQNGGER